MSLDDGVDAAAGVVAVALELFRSAESELELGGGRC
jgi:hypothetical protein